MLQKDMHGGMVMQQGIPRCALSIGIIASFNGRRLTPLDTRPSSWTLWLAPVMAYAVRQARLEHAQPYLRRASHTS